MELFHFVEHSFDINLINKCKKRLGNECLKKINKNLTDLALSDLPLNNVKITVVKKVEKEDKNLIEFGGDKTKIDKESIEFLNYDKENTISSDFIDDPELCSN